MTLLESTSWITLSEGDPNDYNLIGIFRKDFNCRSGKACILLASDSKYRLMVNGRWAQDGPPRSYPKYRLYEHITLNPYLKSGPNRVEIWVRYFGVGTFQDIPQELGLRAEIRAGKRIIPTDSSWECSPYFALERNTPKISNQMEPAERIDGRLAGKRIWTPARCRPQRDRGMSISETPVFTRNPVNPAGDARCQVTQSAPSPMVIPTVRLCHGVQPAVQFYLSRPVVVCARLRVSRTRTIELPAVYWRASICGKECTDATVRLTAGTYTFSFFCRNLFGLEQETPCEVSQGNALFWSDWMAFVVRPFLWKDNDRKWFWYPHRQAEKLQNEWSVWVDTRIRRKAIQPASFKELEQRSWPVHELLLPDVSARFARRKAKGHSKPYRTSDWIHPSQDGDIELLFDFGDQTCGYTELRLDAPAGVEIEGHGVEFISPEGVIQHTTPFNRNHFVYITRKGTNRFFSFKRRSGRYWFLVLRNQSAPVRIRSFRIIEAIAPVQALQPFQTDRTRDGEIWRISERTLQLCSEDTYTDCPLYEQTCWIGDARNESLYGMITHGESRISRRSLELGAQSLERFPIVGCQVPSGWDTLLPAWSFLWGIHAWEHYFYTADRKFLRHLWPAIQKNIEGAESYLDSRGLFTSTHWNLFDWAPIARNSPTLLHNSMLMVGALKAAASCGQALGMAKAAEIYRKKAGRMAKTIHRFWDPGSGTYPDAIHPDGKPGPEFCQHTSLLSILFDIAPPADQERCLENLLDPPKSMTRIGSPFAMQFLMEALEKCERYDEVLKAIDRDYMPMLKAGSTTVWEMFSGSTFETGPFPTRSHCHAWASGPLWFSIRVVLGARQTRPGGRAFQISPWIAQHRQAEGVHQSMHGPIKIRWRRSKNKVTIIVNHPKMVQVEFAPNASLQACQVDFQTHAVD